MQDKMEEYSICYLCNWNTDYDYENPCYLWKNKSFLLVVSDEVGKAI